MSSEPSSLRALPTSPRPTPAHDRVPPHNLDAEVSVLGSMLLSRAAIAEVSEILRPEDFYRGAHRTVYEAVHDLYDRGEPVDLVVLTDELDRRGQLEGVGGAIGLSDLVARVPTAANALYYARIVSEHAVRRRLIDTGTSITRLGYDADGADEAIDEAEQLVYDVAQRGHVSEFTPMKQLVTESFELIERLHENDSSLTGLATGFADFDELTAGLQPSNLVILAARPAMGKCLAGSSRVLDPLTGTLRPIAELVRERTATVTALDTNHQLVDVPASEFHDNGERDVLRLRTRLGREVVATGNHPLLTVEGWRPLESLSPGQRIATPRRLPVFGHDALPEREVEMLGYLLGDGALCSGGVRFYNTGPRLVDEVRCTAAHFGTRMVLRAPHHYSLATRRGEHNRLIERLRMHGLMGAKASTKFVPDAVFRLPREQVATFLNRLFACDGSVYVGRTYAQVTFTSISDRLIRDVQHLLLRFGVIAQRRELVRSVYEGTDKRAWELQITGPASIRTFAREIGIFGKEARLIAAVELLDGREGSPNHDLVPAGVWAEGTRAKGEQSWRQPALAMGRKDGHNSHVGQRSPSRAMLAEMAEATGEERLGDLAHSDVYWDEVVAIEPAGRERVYDLTVPGLHNFVAEDVIVHNSTLVTNLATHVAVEQRKPAVIFSLEMSKMELVQRILAAQARVDSSRLRTGRLQDADWPKLSQAMGRLAEAPLFIDDTAGINLMEIRSKCRRLKQKHGLDLIIVDYLQLMQSHRRVENRVQEVSELSRGLKILAKELDVPVIALSQLSRKPEERTDRRPQLADLRESGSIEQDADIVLFIYRDEVYDPESPARGEAELIVSKHRNGPLATVRLSFIGHHSRFANMARGSSAASRGGGPALGGAPPGIAPGGPPPGAF